MRLTFEQFLLERLSKEQTPGTSDLKASGEVKISGSSPRSVGVPAEKSSEILNGFSPEVLYGKSSKKRQKK